MTRATRGLALVFLVSVVNLAGAFLAIATLGGLEPWSPWQFVGLFGLVETAMGVAFIVGPNVWRLPVAEGNTSERTHVRIAPGPLLIPHWAAVAKSAAGLVMLLGAIRSEGASLGTLALLPVGFGMLVAVLGLSLIFARLGVARPDLDVFAFTLHRPGHEDRRFPGLSIGGMVVQLVINIGVFPAVKLFPPRILYQPALAPSPGFVAWSCGVALIAALAAFATWHDRFALHAPQEQQREAEAEAEGLLT